MKGLKKTFAIILLTVIIYTSVFAGFKINNSIAANLTGNNAYISLAWERYKIGGFWTYIKNGARSLDLFCVQHGAPLDSYGNYLYSEANWDNQAGIFKNEDSYKKLTWIKNNFWEKTNASEGSKYSPEEKARILNSVDNSITVADVNAVFNNSAEKFKLYQTISWNYVQNYAWTYYSLTGSTDKVYKAIIKLADKYYNVAQELKLEETSNIVANEDGTYTWGMKTTNTYALPYSHKLLVDGKEWKDYTYSNNVINISNVGTGKHTFRFLVSTYQVSSSASIWLNNVKQNMLDITSTKKEYKEASKEATLVHEVKEPGYFTLKIKKEDNKGNPLKDVNFSVNNNTYTSNNDGEAIIIDDTNKVEINETDKVYEYTVEELSDNLNGYSRLKNPVTIELKSAVKGENGKLIYYLRSANFKENGMNEIEVESENGKTVKLKLNISDNGNITNVTVTVPNVEKIFDLALTKTILIPQTELTEKYDFNCDGVVDASDGSMAQRVLREVMFSDDEPIKIIRDVLKEFGENEEIYKKYYETLEDELILYKFDLNGDGVINNIDYAASIDILKIYTTQLSGMDVDRIQGVNATNLNKDNETTSIYNMNKSLKRIKKGDIITYKINVYNEGDYNAKDIEVTDYIPQGLVVCDKDGNTNLNDNKIVCSYNGNDYTWTIDGKIAKTTINDEIPAFDGTTLRDGKVYITCKLEDSVQTGDVLYNVAEITNAKATENDGTIVKTQGEDIEDRDSFKDTVKGNKEVQDLINDYKDRFVEKLGNENDEYINKSIYNYEDDDDFERIVITDEKEFDLALRKSISKIGNSFENMQETQNRLPEINDITVSNCKKTGTGAYYHNKEALKVKVGDYVEYTIRIYNEGSITDYSGYAKQITDYLPDGMEFYAIVNKDGNWISTENNGKYVTEKNGYGGYELTYDKTNNKVIIDCIDTPALNTKNNLNTIYNLYKSGTKINGYYTSDKFESATSYAYQEVKIICKVTDPKKETYLTDVAEITDSIAVVDGQEDASIKDRDSIAKNIEITKQDSNLTNKKVNLDTYYEENNVDDTYKPYYPGLEDDDDFETVIVERTPGTPEIHKGVKDILNQDSGYNGDEEHDWVIHTTVPEEMNMFTKYIVTDTIDERLVFSGIEKVTVKIGTKELVKDTDYKVNYDSNTRKLKISFIEGDFVAGKSFEENGVIEITFKTTFAKDEQGNIIALNQEIPNKATLIYDNGSGTDEEKDSEEPEVHTGAVAVYKYNEETKVALEGAKFKIATSKENAEKGIFVKDVNGKDLEAISNNKGIATFTGLEFGGDANVSEENKKSDGTYSYDFENAKKTYYIVETEAPEGFNKIEGVIEVEVSKNTTLTEIKDMKSIANTPIGEFDLALRKFITGVTNGYGNKQEVTTRKPVFKIENGKYVYNHDKNPVLVGNQNIVEYTIRVYNEGTIAGYAKEIKDDIPDGLEFLPNDETNKEYRWIMLDEEGNETDDTSKAKYITTDYLSKENEEVAGENLLKPFNEKDYEAGSINEPDNKEVKVAFKVKMPNTSNEIIINQAQISDDSDEDGNEVTDKDSTPDEWNEGEDDQDIEQIKVQYFDLALRKWITKAIVIEDGKETVHETGHKAEDDPEAVVKVDLKNSKIDKVVVKFEYQIRVTNEGEIAGSVEEISDYIPEGLRFVAADNEGWEEVDGKVVTNSLAGQIIEPGESKEVTILLTWINGKNNMGLKVNLAEISKDYNEYGSPDIDSTPNNKVPGEDDIDDAPVLLSPSTGQQALYIGLGISVLVILACGIVTIKKLIM